MHYAHVNQNNTWQRYVSGTEAAFAKELLRPTKGGHRAKSKDLGGLETGSAFYQSSDRTNITFDLDHTTFGFAELIKYYDVMMLLFKNDDVV
ncbi:MAG: hypothetical protein GOMPHAMPRED_002861 [Gomphillus americanus]|uniref:Uncharacterized protein n=1 Tax=Gomphillus americanus TaxID=1940652 RepID=A0A8H3FFC4_9LECA|nr:MAG: hypothetical protein GOMPHAMPRED_002861 [Gomphillus americanus]